MIARELDADGYAAMASLDLSAAFDLVDLDLLMKRLKKMGLPIDILQLLEVWLQKRYYYVEANSSNSQIFMNDIGTIQGSILGPILYALFIRPLYEVEKMTTFADDNYVVELGKNKNTLLEDLKRKLEKIIQWLKDSGLKVNESKTEVCIFHRNDTQTIKLSLQGQLIKSI